VSLDHEFRPSDYDFPRLYIRGAEGGEYLIPDPSCGVYRIAREPPSGVEALGLAPYEAGWGRIFDPVEAVVTEDFAVVIPWLGRRALYLRRGTRLSLVEAAGVHVNLVAREGDEVGRRSVLAYVVTGRGDTRTVRAGVEGLVVYIAWEPGGPPERYVYLIARGSDVAILEPGTP
jgi:hypothetical protein